MPGNPKFGRGQNPASRANLNRQGRDLLGKQSVTTRLLPGQVQGLNDLVAGGAATDRSALLGELVQIALDFAEGREPADVLDDMQELLFEGVE
jgi:hypothetical protein